MFYKIEESVGSNYITWEGIFDTPEAAMRRIQKELGMSKSLMAVLKGRVQIVLYVRGESQGPVRA